jgi:hypothetical protein
MDDNSKRQGTRVFKKSSPNGKVSLCDIFSVVNSIKSLDRRQHKDEVSSEMLGDFGVGRYILPLSKRMLSSQGLIQKIALELQPIIL